MLELALQYVGSHRYADEAGWIRLYHRAYIPGLGYVGGITNWEQAPDGSLHEPGTAVAHRNRRIGHESLRSTLNTH